MLNDPLAPSLAPVASYTEAIRDVVDKLRNDVDMWERDGHIALSAYRDLAAVGAFAQRWAKGDTKGTRYAVAMAAELGRLSPSLALSVGIHSEVFIGTLASVETRRPAASEVLDAAIEGVAIGCLAATEAGGGSDLRVVETRAVRDDDGWRLTGAKRFVTMGLRATHALVSARSDATANPNALSLFLLPLSGPGVTRSQPIRTLGMRGSGTCALRFDARVSDEHRIGPAGFGLVLLVRALRRERLVAAVQLVTGATTALAIATSFARSRLIAGRRLFDHQAISHQLADCAAELHAARSQIVAVMQSIEEGGLGDDAEVSAAKLFAGRVANKVADVAMQALGGRGYTEDFPIERLWRDARLARIGGGADEVMREIILTSLDRTSEQDERMVAAELASEARLFGGEV